MSPQPHIISQEEEDAAPEPLPDRRRRSTPTRIPIDEDDIPFPTRPSPTDPAPLPKPTRCEPIAHRYNLRSRNERRGTMDNVRECNAVVDSCSGAVLNYHQLIRGPDANIWIKSCANDLGRLAQGVGTRMPTGTNTIFFIPYSRVPSDRTVSYVNPVCSIRPNKSEIYRTRLTAGGDRLEYPGITSTDTVSLCTAKIHINSVISTPNGKYLVTDIKDFYYGTPLTRYEYLRMHIKLIPEEIIRQYNLLKIVHNDYVYLEVRKGMPGLKQAGKVANDRLNSI